MDDGGEEGERKTFFIKFLSVRSLFVSFRFEQSIAIDERERKKLFKAK